MAALFSSQAAGGGGAEAGGGGGSAHLVEFRAGKMTMRGKMVHPDPRKGLVYVTQSEDMLMHLCWRDRTTGQVEDDLIIFPDDTEFLSVGALCPTGRVFLLRFKNQAGRKLFFWMQEPSADKDTEHCAKVNELLNNPPTARAGQGAGAGAGGQAAAEAMLQQLGGEDGMDLGSQLGVDPNQMMQLLQQMMGGNGQLDASQLMAMGGAGGGLGGLMGQGAPPSTPPAASAPAQPSAPSAPARPNAPASDQPAGGAIALSDLQNILSNMGTPGQAAAPQGGPGIDLEDVLGREEVRTAAEAAPESLLAHLPAETPAELAASLRSPQLRQAAGTFGVALQSGQLAPVLRQFDLPESAIEAASRGDTEMFAAALESAGVEEAGGSSGVAGDVAESPEKKEPPPKKEKKDPEMDLD